MLWNCAVGPLRNGVLCGWLTTAIQFPQIEINLIGEIRFRQSFDTRANMWSNVMELHIRKKKISRNSEILETCKRDSIRSIKGLQSRVEKWPKIKQQK